MKIRTFSGRAHLLASMFMAALATAAIPVGVHAQDRSAAAVSVGNNDLGGVVRSAKGPEAGVWVIAETTDTPTRYTEIVVTDDRGRYLIPDLPKGNYQVWVRGYGLVDPAKVQAPPGNMLDLTAMPAPTPAAAAQYYPPIYWFSLLPVPGKNEFPMEHIKSRASG